MINLTKASNLTPSNDSIVILLNTYTLEGGRTLDTTGFAPDFIKAGHVVIREDATGVYKPMPVSGANFGSLPSDHSYVGVVVASVDKETQGGGGVGVMIQGAVNVKAMPYNADSILTALKTALNNITFTYDNY